MTDLDPALEAEALRVSAVLLADAERADFRGYDPFDALNSVVFKWSGLGRMPFCRLAWLQFHKRSPINFRRLVGVPQERNPKGVALYLLGELEGPVDGSRLKRLSHLGDWLLSASVDRQTWGGFGWGYNFDWQARAFFVPKGTPNAITTTFVTRALLALGRATGEGKFVDAALEAGKVLDRLLHGRIDGHAYYQYIPGHEVFVHNASLWTAAIVALTARLRGDADLVERALEVATVSACMQADDGSWEYGTRPHHRFIDGFHTGYNLEALALLDAELPVSQFEDTIRRGLGFYEANFFTDQGDCKYYNSATLPIDTHSFAQALVTLVRLGDRVTDSGLLGKVAKRGIETLFDEHGRRFVYQITRTGKNRVAYRRWTQAWAFYALKVLISQRKMSDLQHSF